MFLGKLYCLERKHEEAKEILEKKDGEQIEATDVKATSIDTEFIYAHSIIASDIIARHISYYTVCFADKMKYTSITNRKENSTSFMLDNDAIINEDEYRLLNQISK